MANASERPSTVPTRCLVGGSPPWDNAEVASAEGVPVGWDGLHKTTGKAKGTTGYRSAMRDGWSTDDQDEGCGECRAEIEIDTPLLTKKDLTPMPFDPNAFPKAFPEVVADLTKIYEEHRATITRGKLQY